jgi:hypothetical protein
MSGQLDLQAATLRDQAAAHERIHAETGSRRALAAAEQLRDQAAGLERPAPTFGASEAHEQDQLFTPAPDVMPGQLGLGA